MCHATAAEWREFNWDINQEHRAGRHHPRFPATPARSRRKARPCAACRFPPDESVRLGMTVLVYTIVGMTAPCRRAMWRRIAAGGKCDFYRDAMPGMEQNPIPGVVNVRWIFFCGSSARRKRNAAPQSPNSAKDGPNHERRRSPGYTPVPAGFIGIPAMAATAARSRCSPCRRTRQTICGALTTTRSRAKFMPWAMSIFTR